MYTLYLFSAIRRTAIKVLNIIHLTIYYNEYKCATKCWFPFKDKKDKFFQNSLYTNDWENFFIIHYLSSSSSVFFFLFIWCLSLFHSFICNVMYDEWYIIISANYHTSRSLKYYIFNHHRKFCIHLKNI